MRVRMVGLPDEIAPIVEALHTALDVVEVSAPYPCRGASRNVRVYAEVRPLSDAADGITAELRAVRDRIDASFAPDADKHTADSHLTLEAVHEHLTALIARLEGPESR
ncbi:hypothetical protein [Actinomadura gamaensis]|uniref:Uncharacterized protein n=1 Tax=Actinomadura gamaensis TaxID=1763541 RepID=A0ABV9U374_9ACTN